MIATLLFALSAPIAADSMAADSTAATIAADSAAATTATHGAAATVAADSAAAPRPVLTLPEVSVERTRAPVGAAKSQPTGFVSDVRVGDTGHAFETLAELVSRTAAVRIQQYGGLGSFATVSLRGASPNQLSVYLDGVPLSSAAQDVVNLSDLPVTAIDRLEVYRGPAPLALGPPTPGGAINVITLPASALDRVSLKRGSFGTWEGVATAGVRRGRWSALVHGGVQQSRGDFGYHDDNGTPLNPTDDAASVRQNNRFDGRTLLGTLAGSLPLGVGLTLRQSMFHKTQGVPGLGAVPALATHLELERDLGVLDLSRPAVRLLPSLDVQLSRDRARSRFRDLVGELGAGHNDTDDRLSGEQLRVTAVSPRLARRLTLETSGLLRVEGATLHDAAGSHADPPDSRRDSRGVSAELRFEPWPGRTLLRAGRRWDRQHDALRSTSSLGVSSATDVVRQLDSPQLGAQVRLPRGLELKSNWSRAERSPEFLELFGNEGSVRGNPALKPERSDSWDAGGGWAASPGGGVHARVEWAHFEQQAHDLIVYVHNSASSVRALNIARARIRGEELSARLELPRGLAASGWATWQSTIDLGSAPSSHGRRLPQRLEHHRFGQLEWRGRWLDAEADVEWLGEDYEDRANRLRVPSRTLTGVTLGVRPLPGARVAIEAKNLGNVRAADVAGFPLPGRSLFLSCEWDLESRPRH